MKKRIDVQAVLTPIAGENPAGEDLRYSTVYDQIKEARRADDALARGDWQVNKLKESEWDKVVALSLDALLQKTKDLQIAAWLLEGLIRTEGFEGLAAGLGILTGLMKGYWENLYPEMEDGDLDYRAAPIEFINDKLSPLVKLVPVTEPGAGLAYSWIQWQESRQVGHEKDILNKYGDMDEDKKRHRDELIEEGKVPPEVFDGAVARSSREFYESLAGHVVRCQEEFKAFDATVDDRFASQAPRLAELRTALEECELLVMRLLKEKGGTLPTAEGTPPEVEAVEGAEEPRVSPQQDASQPLEPLKPNPAVASAMAAFTVAAPTPVSAGALGAFSDGTAGEEQIWAEALRTMQTAGIKTALGQLLEASTRAPSIRDRNRYRLLMARLCLEANRPDLARPLVEELHALIEELNLERWESPRWIAEVLDALYQCLVAGQPSDDDISRAQALFRKLCVTDVTRAVLYRD